MHEALSLNDVQDRLIQSITDLAKARKDLSEARDAETDADLEYQAAHRRALLSPECPVVRRDGYTAAERDAWVAQQVEEQYAVYRRAKTRREAADDHNRTVREIASAVQSLGATVRSTYQMAGAE